MADYRHISCAVKNSVLVVTLTDAKIQGDDLGDALRDELLAALSQSDVFKVIIDFQAVTFLSSAGFRPLLSLNRKLREKRGRMIFCNLAPQVEEVLVVTRLLGTSPATPAPFEKAADLSEALSRLRRFGSRVDKDVLILELGESKLHGDELAEELTREFLACARETGAKHVILDCRQVKSIATPCLRPLLSVRGQVKPQGGRVVLCHLAPLVREVLVVTRLIANGNPGPAPLEATADLPAALLLLAS